MPWAASKARSLSFSTRSRAISLSGVLDLGRMLAVVAAGCHYVPTSREQITRNDIKMAC
jgi:hypothetical protein